MPSINKMLVPLDFSARSSAALQYAVELARRHGAKIELVSVLDVGVFSLADDAPAPEPEEYEHTYTEIERRLEEARQDALAAGASAVETRLLHGRPDVEILRVAMQDRPDLIVMGTHRRTTERHALMDSVAERLMRHAPCPVFTVDGSRLFAERVALS